MVDLGVPEARWRVVDRIRLLHPATPSRWGKMSAPQMICHLSDSFGLALGARSASMATGLMQRTVMKWVALNVPFPWPKDLPTRPEMEQGVGGTPPGDFECDRTGLIQLIDLFAEPGRDFQTAIHPMFGTMCRRDWMRWGYLHADHHLRQFGV